MYEHASSSTSTTSLPLIVWATLVWSIFLVFCFTVTSELLSRILQQRGRNETVRGAGIFSFFSASTTACSSSSSRFKKRHLENEETATINQPDNKHMSFLHILFQIWRLLLIVVVVSLWGMKNYTSTTITTRSTAPADITWNSTASSVDQTLFGFCLVLLIGISTAQKSSYVSAITLREVEDDDALPTRSSMSAAVGQRTTSIQPMMNRTSSLTNEFKGWALTYVWISVLLSRDKTLFMNSIWGTSVFLFWNGYIHTIHALQPKSPNEAQPRSGILPQLIRLNLLSVLLFITVPDITLPLFVSLTHTFYFLIFRILFARKANSNNSGNNNSIVSITGATARLIGLSFILYLLTRSSICSDLLSNFFGTYDQSWCTTASQFYLLPILGSGIAYVETLVGVLPHQWFPISAHVYMGFFFAVGVVSVAKFRIVPATIVPISIYQFYRKRLMDHTGHVSLFFVFIGKHSLELFVLSYYLWKFTTPGFSQYPLLKFVLLISGITVLSQQAYCSTRFWVRVVISGFPTLHTAGNALIVVSIVSAATCLTMSLMSALSSKTFAISVISCGLFLLAILQRSDSRSAGSRSSGRSRVIAMVVSISFSFCLSILGWEYLIGPHLSASVASTAACSRDIHRGRWIELDSCSVSSTSASFSDTNVMSMGTCSPTSPVFAWGWELSGNKGCTFFHRQPNDILRTLAGRRVLFAGDSIIRHLYHSLCRQVGDIHAGAYNTSSGKWANYSRSYSDVHLDFIWSPYADQLDDVIGSLIRETASVDLLVVGGGPWDRLHRYSNETERQQLASTVRRIASGMKKMKARDTAVVWSVPTTINTWGLLSEEKRNNIREDQMAEIRQFYKAQGTHDAASFVLDGPTYTADRVSESYDGVHYPLVVYDAGAQILANAFEWLVTGALNRPASRDTVRTPPTSQAQSSFPDFVGFVLLTLILGRRDPFLFSSLLCHRVYAGPPDETVQNEEEDTQSLLLSENEIEVI